jgi:hypothetical protein
MRSFSIAATPVLILLFGCAAPAPPHFNTVTGPSHSAAVLPAAPAPAPVENRKPAPAPTPAIVTPDQVLAGKVTRFNEAGRFAVLEFPITHMPAIGQILFVYRSGLKVGEVKVTGPQRDDHTVADLTTGEALPGDEVRDK